MSLRMWVDYNIPKNYKEAIKYIKKNYSLKNIDGLFNNLEDALDTCEKKEVKKITIHPNKYYQTHFNKYPKEEEIYGE